MDDLTLPRIEAYLKRQFGERAQLLDAGEIGTLDKSSIKRFGYGKPLLVRWREPGPDGAPREREGVLSVMKGDKYGHQFAWDRAAILWFQYATSARLPGHVLPLGLGYVDGEGELLPLHEPREFFLLNEKLPGHDYAEDLKRIRAGDFRASDEEQARALARWLADVHAARLDDPDLYYRRVRDLIGSSECIMGLIDEAFPHPFEAFSEKRFRNLERRLVDWRWKLKGHAHRLAAVHGDFHPWNILVEDTGAFRVLDRSRGEWGEPAGDVCTMAVNYLLFGLLDSERFEGPFRRLYDAFFTEYLERTGDEECLEVMAPFLVFRALVVASPEWYPDHPPRLRQGLMNLAENVLAEPAFDWRGVERYMDMELP